jgi:hypothetical protein
VSLLRQEIADQGSSFINSANSLFNRAGVNRSASRVLPTCRLGVTVYYFQDDVESAARTKTDAVHSPQEPSAKAPRWYRKEKYGPTEPLIGGMIYDRSIRGLRFRPLQSSRGAVVLVEAMVRFLRNNDISKNLILASVQSHDRPNKSRGRDSTENWCVRTRIWGVLSTWFSLPKVSRSGKDVRFRYRHIGGHCLSAAWSVHPA